MRYDYNAVFASVLSPYNDQGRIQVRDFVQQQREAAQNERSPETADIQNEFQRSMERRTLLRPSDWQEAPETSPPVGTTLTPTTTTVTNTTVQRPDLLQRLQAVKQKYQPRTLQFDDTIVEEDAEAGTTIPQFERFQLQDLSPKASSNLTILGSDEMNAGEIFDADQEEFFSGDKINAGELFDQGVVSSEDSELTILNEDAMYTDDIFGADHIAEADVLPNTQTPIHDNEILNDSEMLLDDIFGAENIADISTLPANRIECIEAGRRVMQELIAAQQISSTPQVTSPTQQLMSSVQQVTSPTQQVTSPIQQVTSPTQQLILSTRLPISSSPQYQRPLNLEEPSILDLDDTSVAETLLSDELQPSFSSNLEGTASDLEDIIVPIPIPGRPGLVTYAPSEQAEQIARLLEQADDVTKTVIASIGQTFKVGVLKKRYLRSKGLPDDNQRPTFEQLYAAVDPDLLDPIAERTHREHEAHILDFDDNQGAGLLAPLLRSPTQPKRENDDRVQGYHNYLTAMQPYVADANIRPMASSEGSIDEPYWSDDNLANRRISHYSTPESSEEYPDLLLDSIVSSPKEGQLVDRQKRGYLDESFTYSGDPTALIPPPRPKPPVQYDPAPNQPDLWFDSSPKQQRLRYRRKHGILDESLDNSGGPTSLIPPPSQPLPIRRDPGLLSSDEMLTDDLFGDDAIAQPERQHRPRTPTLNDAQHRFYQELAAGHHRRDAYEQEIDEEHEPTLVDSFINMSSNSDITTEEDLFDIQPEFVESIDERLSDDSTQDYQTDRSESVDRRMAATGDAAQQSEQSSDGILNTDDMFTEDLFGADAATEPVASSSQFQYQTPDRRQTDSYQDDGSVTPTEPFASSTQNQYQTPARRDSFQNDGTDVSTDLINWTTPVQYQTSDGRQTDDFDDDILHSDDIEDDIAELIGSNVPVSPSQRSQTSYHHDSEILHPEDMQDDIFETIGSNVMAPTSFHRRTAITGDIVHDDIQDDIFIEIGQNVVTSPLPRRRQGDLSSSVASDEEVTFAVPVPGFVGAFVYVTSDRLAAMTRVLAEASDEQKISIITDAQDWLSCPNRPQRIIYPQPDDDEILDDAYIQDDIVTEIGQNVVTSPLSQSRQGNLSSSDGSDEETFAVPVPGFIGAFVYVSSNRIAAMTGVLAEASDEQKVSIINDAQDWLSYPNRPQNIIYPNPEAYDKFRNDLSRIFRLQINRELPNIDDIPVWPESLTSVLLENAFYALPVPGTRGNFVYAPTELFSRYFQTLTTSNQNKIQQMIQVGKDYMSSSRAPKYIYYLREDKDQNELLQRLQRMVEHSDDARELPDDRTHYAIPVPGINGAFIYVPEENIEELIRFLDTATDAEKILCIDENQKFVNGPNRPRYAVYMHDNEVVEDVQPTPDDTYFAVPVPGYDGAFVYVLVSQIDGIIQFLADATDDQKQSLISDAQQLMVSPDRPLNIIYPAGERGVAEQELNYAPAVSDHYRPNDAAPVQMEIPNETSQAVLDQSPEGVQQFNRLLNEPKIIEENRRQLDPIGESLAKSLEQSARYRELQDKYRRKQNLEPIGEVAPVFPALQQYNDLNTFVTTDEFEPIGSPVSAQAPRREDLDESLEKRVQYAIEAENRSLQSSQQRYYQLDDPFNRRINMSTIEADLYEDEIEDMLYENTPPKYKHRQHPSGQIALLDESIESTEVLAEPMLKGPAKFPERYDTDLLNESEMDVDDMFGDNAIAEPEPMHRPAGLGGPKPISPAYVRDVAKDKIYSDMAAGKFRNKEMFYGDLDLVEEPEEFYDYDQVPDIRIIPPTPERRTTTPLRLHRHQTDPLSERLQHQLYRESHKQIATPIQLTTPEHPHFGESPYRDQHSEPQIQIATPNPVTTPDHPQLAGSPQLPQLNSEPKRRIATPNLLTTPELPPVMSPQLDGSPDGSPQLDGSPYLHQHHSEPQRRIAIPKRLATPEYTQFAGSPHLLQPNSEARGQNTTPNRLAAPEYTQIAGSPQLLQPYSEPRGHNSILNRLATPELQQFAPQDRTPQLHEFESPTTAAINKAISQTLAIDAIRQKLLERQNRAAAASQAAEISSSAHVSPSSSLNYSVFAQRRTPSPATPNVREYDDDLNWQDGLYGDEFQQPSTGRRHHDAYSPLDRRIYEEQHVEDLLDTSAPQNYEVDLSTSPGEQEQSALDILDEDQMITDDIFGEEVISGM